MRLEEFDLFKTELRQLCAVLGKAFSDPLCQAYWAVLRAEPLDSVRERVGRYIAHANAETKFPRPAQLRGERAEAVALPEDDGFQGDRWDIASNHLLMAYIRRRLAAGSRRWGAPGSPEQAAATRVLVRHKKGWAALMRSWDVDPDTGELMIPPAVDQNAAWKASMESAEAEIAAPPAKAA